MNFASDNWYGVSPEIMAALNEVNQGTAGAYGGDDTTAKLTERMSEVFEKDIAVFPVSTGTAGNALALLTVVPSHGAVICHEEAHILVDECGAVQTLTGGCLMIGMPGLGAKLSADALRQRMKGFVRGDHDPRRAAVSITQSTELGTAYTLEEISGIGEVCRENGMRLHMDGARFANALASLDCSPAEMTWKAGVDVLTFGATKNGAMSTDAVVFFDTSLAEDFDRRRLMAGQLTSKGRYSSAQLLAYLEDDLWLKNARAANARAAKLGAGLKAVNGIRLHVEPKSNSVFPVLPGHIHEALQSAGAIYHCWPPNPNSGPVPEEEGEVLARLVCSFATPEADVDQFVEIAKAAL